MLPRPPTISNPPPLISSTKHPSVLERQMSAISQVRREGQGLPRSVCVAWCPENSPFLFWGFSLSIYKMGASEAVIAGWELDTQGARVISMHSTVGV